MVVVYNPSLQILVSLQLTTVQMSHNTGGLTIITASHTRLWNNFQREHSCSFMLSSISNNLDLVGGFTLLCYDYLLTFDQEVRFSPSRRLLVYREIELEITMYPLGQLLLGKHTARSRILGVFHSCPSFKGRGWTWYQTIFFIVRLLDLLCTGRALHVEPNRVRRTDT